MLRRSLLAALGASASTALLGGCGVRLTDPRIHGTPMPPFTPPPPPPYPGGYEGAALESAAWSALLSAAAAPGADAASLGKLAAIRARHVEVLSTAEPYWRHTAASPPPPPTAAPAATKEAGLVAASTALVTLRDAAVDRAVSSPGLAAILWASVAASADQSRLWLGIPVGAVAAAVPGRVVTVMDETAAIDVVLDRYHEAVFGLSSLIGFLPNNHPLRPTLVAQLVAARTKRDALMAYDRAASASPTPGAGAYPLPPAPADQVSARAGALLAAVTQAVGVWVASASDQSRRRAVQELVYAAGAGVTLGTGLAEWPGWPD